ncbi:MAG: EamA family transporter [Acutalibacteraceae bacterium]|nr:EamA family transporter [Acutalibacteraceae bacterium]
MLYLLLFSIVFASLNSVLLHKAKITRNDIFKFNFLCAAVWCICLFIANGFELQINKSVLLWGIIYGVTQTLFILFKTLAMNSGSVSITTLVGNFSLVISVVFCFIVWGEAISLLDIVGLIFLMVGIILSSNKKSSSASNSKWPIYLVFFLVFAAAVGISFKAFSKTGQSEYAGDMMLVAAMVMLVTYAFICLFTRKCNSADNGSKINKEFIVYALASGMLSCVYNRLNIYLSATLDAVIFFPAFNGGVIMLSTVLSLILLKEKLDFKTSVGILLGIAGICIIGIL